MYWRPPPPLFPSPSHRLPPLSPLSLSPSLSLSFDHTLTPLIHRTTIWNVECPWISSTGTWSSNELHWLDNGLSVCSPVMTAGWYIPSRDNITGQILRHLGAKSTEQPTLCICCVEIEPSNPACNTVLNISAQLRALAKYIFVLSQ